MAVLIYIWRYMLNTAGEYFSPKNIILTFKDMAGASSVFQKSRFLVKRLREPDGGRIESVNSWGYTELRRLMEKMNVF